MRRSRFRSTRAPEESDGILDILANLVGVLTLVGALSSIVAANAAIKIKTPMSRETSQEFHLIVAGSSGLYDMQPAREAAMIQYKALRSRKQSCFRYSLYGVITCLNREKNFFHTDSRGEASYTVRGDGTILIDRKHLPSIDFRGDSPDQETEAFIRKIKTSGKAIYVLLEKEGFDAYRSLKVAAQSQGVDIGWTTWGTQSTISIGSGGRSMTIQ